MPEYKVAAASGIKRLATGQSWRKGQAIGPYGIKARLWQSWLDQGAVVEVQPVPEELPEPEPAKKPVKKTRATRKAKEVTK